MLARALERFVPGRPSPGRGILALIISDYLACYRQRGESPSRLALLFLPRLLLNPELHATALMRVALGGPRSLFPVWRSVLIAKHSIDIMPDTEIGPGLRLPHPMGICLGWALIIGSDVTIYHNVSIGSEAKPSDVRAERHGPHVPPSIYRPCPHIEDEVVIYTGSLLTGPIRVGRGAVVGAESWLDHDLPAGAVHKGRRQRD